MRTISRSDLFSLKLFKTQSPATKFQNADRPSPLACLEQPKEQSHAVRSLRVGFELVMTRFRSGMTRSTWLATTV
jgi:hypothetical protein